MVKSRRYSVSISSGKVGDRKRIVNQSPYTIFETFPCQVSRDSNAGYFWNNIKLFVFGSIQGLKYSHSLY